VLLDPDFKKTSTIKELISNKLTINENDYRFNDLSGNALKDQWHQELIQGHCFMLSSLNLVSNKLETQCSFKNYTSIIFSVLFVQL
tara:strand:+ start:2010 stop:2267 length:258 start_codon:yes stop_codon:yes gene_type:complete